MTKVYTSAVVIIPPEEKWSPIQTIRPQPKLKIIPYDL